MVSASWSRRTRWLLLSALAWCCVAAAQSYPSRAIRLIVPFGPGSGSDVSARIFAKYLQERWKQPVVVENRPGANGTIGTTVLKSSPADGYTLGISTNSTHAAAPYLVRALGYDPIADFEHVALVGVGGSVALVPANSPFKSIPELVAYANAHRGRVFFGHADTIAQVSAELLKVRANIPIEGVPYKTSAQVIADLISGQVQFGFFNSMTAAAQMAAGRLVPIAISEGKRNRRWPAVPAVSETYPGLEVTYFVGISVPRGVPAPIVATLNRAINEAQTDAAVRAPLESAGLTFVRQTPGEYRSFVIAQSERWKAHIKAAKLQAQ